MDFRVGGAYRFVMRGPDGLDYPFHGVYREIVPLARIVFTAIIDNAPGNELVTTVTFAEEGGKTKLSMRMIFPSANARDYVVKTYGAMEGMNQTLGRLEEHLAEMLPS